ncbi:CDP-alcohol phosphatidyltransferase family protein [Tuwongella immobilis]|uniref:CDP-diacylglycerol--glycerol-3-phosphate 3-phosphatidyltransferase n=1 Tax=Tuwongella immobilis TaxID=692036 RepID=A0A6C2YHQ1_9BACT|nr:CDP-alcohol phosphatidyltransferase family protein [Tuwongella immobilis]VIP01050.1 cdp-diacylglycerol--glycerol-3-phosphate 3-phosphatidyltransferase : CDP-diacylglycerol--glycerol-3-phosphate 3-phosphatidyltransferase OS=uncultured planctomycete GN=HGMM_F11G08C05 PE=3 SV=1: CDP-OH_P_transf [Tuwongella immobilis]VTR97525.1 cdp-diacylglycerol--glycerol-3-phosphate 3-phosphatidyltransferase : CDP-diacylglycerol--glycerol-3-phosphate 3-phosphatidyltransferase OS=uncultured planctomycete GN=HGMM_
MNIPATNPDPGIWTGPNILTLSRLFWAIVLFVCIAYEWWFAGLIVFGIAALSDWLDGVWARRANLVSSFGRNMDPLIDKVLICGAFIYLIPIPDAQIAPWMVAVVVGRELLITGIRGIVEQAGIAFGADRYGKWKMILQCVMLIVFLSVQTFRLEWGWSEIGGTLHQWLYIPLVWATIGMTLFSGLQYLWKATVLLSRPKVNS